MENYLILILMIIYFIWIITFIFKITDNRFEFTDQNIKTVIDKIYIDIISFKKCKNFTKALQSNLTYQINSLKNLSDEQKSFLPQYLEFIKDSVDINDLTFSVGNDTINMLLRKKVRECYYRNITLDVVCNLSQLNIDEIHLFFIFSNLIDLSIKYLKQNKDNKKYKISIRTIKNDIDNQFIIKLIYNKINNVKDIDMNKYFKNMMDLILIHYNGTVINIEKNGLIIKTVSIPLFSK